MMGYIITYYSMGRKSNKVIMAAREKLITELISQGYTRKNIIQIVSEKFETTELSIAKQYDRMIQELKIDSASMREEARIKFMQRFEYLYQLSLKEKKLKTAMDIVERQAKLLGLYDKVTAEKEQAPTIEIIENDANVLPLKENG